MRHAVILLLALAACPAWAESVTGRLIFRDPKDARNAELRNAVVSFTPAGGTMQPAAGTFELVTVRKQFRPRVLAIPVGSTVRFPNSDPILHNVFSSAAGNRFDLGLYQQGSGKTHTFNTPGVVPVFCNVHHDMVAYVAVLDTPFYMQPLSDGSFRLDDLPEGMGKLTVWHERTALWSRTIRLPLNAPLEIELAISKPRIPKHLNKFGRRYRRGSRNAY